MDGGARVAEVLKAQGVEFLFTLCGGHISPILVEAKKKGIRIIDTRHEVNAVFAADAVARLTGRPGVAAVTAGPGVTNTITAVKNAQMAQSPLVLLGGATATLLRGKGSLQDIDQTSLILPHVKWNARPNTVREIVPALERAFEEAQSGVPGPVFVELAVDLLYAEETVREWHSKMTDKPNKTLAEKGISLAINAHLTKVFFGANVPVIKGEIDRAKALPSRAQIKKASKIIAAAERPVFILGSQLMWHPERREELVAAIEHIGAPCYLSGMARGLLGEGHGLQLRHKRRNALKESDVVVLVGVPCDFRLDYGSPLSRTKLISVNLSERDLKKNRSPEHAVLADPHELLVGVSRIIPGKPMWDDWIRSLKERDEVRDNEILKMGDEDLEHLNPLKFCQEINRQLINNSVLIGDGGDFVATASYIVSPRKAYGWLDPGVFGTLGVGAGFAIGAKLVNPDADVWLLYGDGAAGFSLMELDTCARHGINIIAVVGNDAGWTQIARDQTVILGDDVACRLEYMDYHVVAEGCGAKGLRVDDHDKMKEVLEEAVKVSRSGRPVLVNAILGKSDFRKGSLSM
jgi:acetolactate synthase-like protein